MIAVALLLAQSAAEPAVRGEIVFKQSCAVGYCHGVEGAANRGPRLEGRSFERAYLDRVIRKGIPNSAMPGFEDSLKAQDVQALIAYISRIATVSGPVASVTPAPEATSASPGKALFFDAARGTRCSTCHEAEGAGLSIAPAIPKDATVATVRSKRVKRVRRFILASGESFPALVHSDDKGITKAFDLTTPPPVLRTFREGEIASWEEEREWSHAGATRGYTDAEIKAVLEYVTSAATRPPTK